jgi:TPP-dependent 2-oxoacid decarboxylase
MAKPTFTVSDYLIQRLADFGIAHLFAVPGDYAGPFLSAVDAGNKIVRVGVSNEWVAGYAADAYARLRGTGAACLTYAWAPSACSTRWRVPTSSSCRWR